ncbi:MAG: beta-ribofuranosylaminobenzene 5'-phosphate synthase family protein [Promethearchaeota archaeon]
MRIQIKTPSRLHFTLIDENGSLGRVDGGIGLSLSEPNFEIIVYDKSSLEMSKLKNTIEFEEIILFNSEKPKKKGNIIVFKTKLGNIIISILKTDSPNINALLDTLKDISINFSNNFLRYIKDNWKKYYKDLSDLNLRQLENFPILIEVVDYLSSHIGFGSKTQMCLAIATAISKILNIKLDIITLTELVGRGGTSGIGYRAFEKGGFIFDCGHRFGENEEKTTFLPSSASRAKPARTILRYEFPTDWHILTITLNVPAGASNVEEVNIFQKYCPIPLNDIEKVCHLIFAKILPGIIEKDLDAFGYGINQIQGLGFKKIEIELQHDKVKELMEDLRRWGSKCVGMSSFGPTIYSIYKNRSLAEKSLENVKKKYREIEFSYYLTEANNKGAEILIKK